MSVFVYKSGETLKIAPEHIKYHIDSGWSLNENDQDLPSGSDDPASIPDPDHSLQETASEDTQTNTGPDGTGHTNERIRELAREAGIENAEKAQIKTLKVKLGIVTDEQ